MLSVSNHVFQGCGHFKYSRKAFECIIRYFIGDWYMYNVRHKPQDILWNTQDVLEYIKLCDAVHYKNGNI